MSIKLYVKEQKNPELFSLRIKAILQYVFVGVNSVVAALLFLFFTISVKQSYIASNSEFHSPLGGISSVQGAATSNPEPTVLPTSLLSPTIQIEPSPSVTPTSVSPRLKKKSYRIAIYGDSMIDTMGEILEYLEHALKRKYPDTFFGLYNYGVGAENVETGLGRLYHDFNYKNRHYPPITSINADIIIVGSYAYNPFSPHDRDKHWLTLTKLVQEAQKTGAAVYMLAEVAPLREDFGRGPHGVNWETSTVYQHSARIIEQLENVVGLSKTLDVPLINVFQQTLVDGKKAGQKRFVNPDDGIHPSVEGHELTAEIIKESLVIE